MADVSPEDRTEPPIAGAYISDQHVIACPTKCWPCMFGSHFDPPEWHTWADDEDVEHAKETGQADPTSSRCGCFCAVVTQGPAR